MGDNRGLIVAIVVGLVATLAVLLSPDVPVVVRGPALQATVETTGGLIMLAAALMVHGRFRDTRRVDLGLLQGALTLFGLANLVLGAAPVAVGTTNDSYDTWGVLQVRLLAAICFAAAAVVRSHRRLPLHLPVVCATVTVTVVTVGCALAGDLLPPAATLVGDLTRVTDLTANPVVTVYNVVGLVALLTAAAGFWARRTDPLYRDLAAAAVLGAFARLHLALVPSLYSGSVYSGDLFRLAFNAAVLAATVGEVVRRWNDGRALAVAEERRRVARELHDGMAQELAFIVSTTSRMARGRHDPDLDLTASAARRALEESRRAIATLTRPVDEPLQSALAEVLDDLARRTGHVVAVDLDPLVTVTPSQREELLRIGREAVGNALRHASCSSVHVVLQDDDGVVLRITDDGVGFDPDLPANPHGFGLISMRERAQAIGGTFDVVSTAGHGTVVTVRL